MVKSKIMPTLVLSVICIAVALLLSVVNIFTAPIIEKALNQKENAALIEVYPTGESFNAVDITKYALPDEVEEAYSANDGGYVFKLSVTGYKSGLVIMCGVDADGKITGSKYTESQETNGAENKLDGAYNGKDLESLKPEIVASSTRTSEAYHAAVKAALQSFVILNGGNVDLRDPQQILNDNCNMALGTADLTFTKWFATDEITVDALYLAEGAKGAVALIGESYIGIGENGLVSDSSVSAEDKAKVEESYAVYTSSTLTEVAIPDGAPEGVKKIYVTGKGSYVFELEAKGYGMSHKYGSKLPIVIKLAISPDGKIISTLTVSQGETEGIGDKCADPSYYEKFNGATVENYEAVENITGATYTSTAYKTAMKDAFNTFKLLKGDS